MSSDAGMIPIRHFDDQTCPEPRRVAFTECFVAGLHDPRDPALIDHGFDEMVRQRIYGILAGYEACPEPRRNCNDHDALPAFPENPLRRAIAPTPVFPSSYSN